MNDITVMLKLISAAVYTKKYPEISEDINWGFIYGVASAHGVANIIAYAINEGNYDVPKEIKTQFTKSLLKAIAVCENQIFELNKLFNEFERSNVKYMPLKGTVIRSLYPEKDMRSMADADILVSLADFEKFNNIMLGLGYTFDGESNHEYNYTKKPFVHIELHKYLVPSYNDDLYSYYGDGWRLAKQTNPDRCRFELSVEGHFIYIITHFAKHYRDAGVGMKSVIDIWLYMKKYTEMDMEYVKSQLKKLNLLDFAENVFHMTEVWFEDGKSNSLINQMSEFIIRSSAFGTREAQLLSNTIREHREDVGNVSKHRYKNALFPNLKHMKKAYPMLEKMPVLLPFFWIIRIVQRTLFGSKSISEHKQMVDVLQYENIENFKKHMEDVGLDIYNGMNKQ